jgi:hypothetical protein
MAELAISMAQPKGSLSGVGTGAKEFEFEDGFEASE